MSSCSRRVRVASLVRISPSRSQTKYRVTLTPWANGHSSAWRVVEAWAPATSTRRPTGKNRIESTPSLTTRHAPAPLVSGRRRHSLAGSLQPSSAAIRASSSCAPPGHRDTLVAPRRRRQSPARPSHAVRGLVKARCRPFRRALSSTTRVVIPAAVHRTLNESAPEPDRAASVRGSTPASVVRQRIVAMSAQHGRTLRHPRRS